VDGEGGRVDAVIEIRNPGGGMGGGGEYVVRIEFGADKMEGWAQRSRPCLYTDRRQRAGSVATALFSSIRL
jgi:hypothetical protein